MTSAFGVLWDLDGTLVDTGEFHYQAWAQACAAYGIPYSRAAFQATLGMNNLGTLTALLGEPPPPALLAEIDRQKETLFRAAITGRAEPLPGVLAWLDRLRAAGARQAIASSAPQANIETLVDELGLRRYFAALVAGAALPGKPDPAVFLAAASQIDLPPARCVVIEDSAAGVAGAKRAGMKCVAVATTQPADRLREADVIVARLDRLPPESFEKILAPARWGSAGVDLA